MTWSLGTVILFTGFPWSTPPPFPDYDLSKYPKPLPKQVGASSPPSTETPSRPHIEKFNQHWGKETRRITQLPQLSLLEIVLILPFSNLLWYIEKRGSGWHGSWPAESMCCGCNGQIHMDYRVLWRKRDGAATLSRGELLNPCLDRLLLLFWAHYIEDDPHLLCTGSL